MKEPLEDQAGVWCAKCGCRTEVQPAHHQIVVLRHRQDLLEEPVHVCVGGKHKIAMLTHPFHNHVDGGPDLFQKRTFWLQLPTSASFLPGFPGPDRSENNLQELSSRMQQHLLAMEKALGQRAPSSFGQGSSSALLAAKPFAGMRSWSSLSDSGTQTQ